MDLRAHSMLNETVRSALILRRILCRSHRSTYALNETNGSTHALNEISPLFPTAVITKIHPGRARLPDLIAISLENGRSEHFPNLVREIRGALEVDPRFQMMVKGR